MPFYTPGGSRPGSRTAQEPAARKPAAKPAPKAPMKPASAPRQPQTQRSTGAVATTRTAANAPGEYQYENLGGGWPLFIAICRWFPDFLFDLCRADDADYELTLIQRVIMRAKARYQYCDITGCRGLTKSFCSQGEECTEGLVWPRTKCSYYGPAFRQTSDIGREIYDQLKHNYPVLMSHWEVVSSSKDEFELGTEYGSSVQIRAYRGGTIHKAVAEEYAQEEKPPFNHADYRRVVLPMIRAQYLVNGRPDPTYIPFKQHSITSAGRRQNPAYENRCLNFLQMRPGRQEAFVMDVPYDVVLLMGMRPTAWAEGLKNKLTPEEWAREMESRYTGTDQNPVVRDETLNESRSLLMMEEHHCCKDKENTLKPQDVIYIVGYDVSYADGARNAKCANVVLKLTRQTSFQKRDKFLKQAVWIDDWQPMDHMVQAQKLKQLWYRFTFEGSQTYIAIDAQQYGTAVLQDLMTDLQDGLAPLCTMDHDMYPELELQGALPVIYPIRASVNGSKDPDSEMLRYAIVQFENRNVQLLTFDHNAGIAAYKVFHHIKHDSNDALIYRPYLKTQELVGQIQNLKAVPSGSGTSEKRISNKIQRDSWSALKYALRLAQKLEFKYLMKPVRKRDWDAAFAAMKNRARPAQTANRPRTINRRGGRLF